MATTIATAWCSASLRLARGQDDKVLLNQLVSPSDKKVIPYDNYSDSIRLGARNALDRLCLRVQPGRAADPLLLGYPAAAAWRLPSAGQLGGLGILQRAGPARAGGIPRLRRHQLCRSMPQNQLRRWRARSAASARFGRDRRRRVRAAGSPARRGLSVSRDPALPRPR